MENGDLRNACERKGQRDKGHGQEYERKVGRLEDRRVYATVIYNAVVGL